MTDIADSVAIFSAADYAPVILQEVAIKWRHY
jgi:hypothetical protein